MAVASPSEQYGTQPDPMALRIQVRIEPRRLLAGTAMLVGVVAVAALVGSPLATVSAAVDRMAAADPLFVTLGLTAEVASFAGYVALTSLVVGRAAPRIGVAVSAQITLAGAAVNRMLPTAGLGGIGLTLWALRRAGRSNGEAASALLTFLVLLYVVFLAALAAAGVAVLGGVAGDAPAALGIGLAVFAVAAIASGATIGLAGPGWVAKAPGRQRHRRLHAGAVALAGSVRGAAGFLRSGDARLLGAPAWWGFDLAVLAAALAALGDAPAVGVIALGYFAGIVANTVPVPGAVAGGMTGVLLLSGVPVDLALPAVLVYRAISLWIPVPVGAAALVGLQRAVRRWAEEDAGAVAAPRPVAADPVPPSRAPRELVAGRRGGRPTAPWGPPAVMREPVFLSGPCHAGCP
jgi:uncharacterized membrane protein YbhN (UPF0104 family)